MSTTSALLLLDDERKAQLELLNNIDESDLMVLILAEKQLEEVQLTLTAADICNAALGYLATGINNKSLTSAANHLQLDVETVRATIDSLLWLYTECAKTKISTESLDESLKLLGYKPAIRQSFIDGYQSKSSELQKTLATDLTMSLPRYKNINWRFDVQIATRSLRSRKQIEPFFLLKLTVVNATNGRELTHFLQVDPITLVHLVEQLESALNDIRSNHARRIMSTFR